MPVSQSWTKTSRRSPDASMRLNLPWTRECIEFARRGLAQLPLRRRLGGPHDGFRERLVEEAQKGRLVVDLPLLVTGQHLKLAAAPRLEDHVQRQLFGVKARALELQVLGRVGALLGGAAAEFSTF